MPAQIMRAKAHGVSDDPGVRFTVPGGAGDAEVDGRCWWPTFDEAVAAARSTISDFREGDLGPYLQAGDRTHSRAFVALRASTEFAPHDGLTIGGDGELLRWEVFHDRVVLNEPGVSDDHVAIMAAEPPKAGWA